MEIIPLIYVKNRKIHAEKDGKPVSLDEVLERVNKDGISKNIRKTGDMG